MFASIAIAISTGAATRFEMSAGFGVVPQAITYSARTTQMTVMRTPVRHAG